MELTKIIYEKNEGIASIIINDPKNYNVFSVALRDELEQCLDDSKIDPDVRVVVISGAGPNFSAGGNVKQMDDDYNKGIQPDYDDTIRKWGVVMSKIRTIGKPVISSMHGAVVGGGLTMTLASDFRIVAEDAKLSFVFINLGFIPDLGGGFSLINMIGVAKATELMMTGKFFSGKEACDWGIANEAVPLDKLEETTIKLANKLAQGPTLAYAGIKTLINQVASLDGYDLYIDTEAKTQQMLSFTEDHKEGVRAFVEKRTPVYRGR